MTKSAPAENRHRLWLRGQCVDFFVVNTDVTYTGRNPDGSAKSFRGTLAQPATFPKSQITLHCTAGNGTAEATLNWWNNPAAPAAGSQYVLERTLSNNSAGDVRFRQATRPALQAGADRDDTGLIDAVRLLAEDTICFHAGIVNETAIGIEQTNVGFGFENANSRSEPSLQGTGSGARPLDLNRWIHLTNPLARHTDYQAYEDRQIESLILLLRHLCITHRIARRYFGDSVEEVFRHWAWPRPTPASQRDPEFLARRSAVLHFRGILHHRNVHDSKPCPGIVHRDRVYRGLCDEWWMPIQVSADARHYYSGPFESPPYVAGEETRPAYFHWTGTGDDGNPLVTACTYHDAELEAIALIRSYFHSPDVEDYYAKCETEHGGTFPIGASRVWHGGVHFHPPAGQSIVYAMAGGTIVAARLSSNPDTESADGFGSQRFVLVRHCLHCNLQDDPGGRGQRLDYESEPLQLYTLYMHLQAFANLEQEDNANPPWFNLWLRHTPMDQRPQLGLSEDEAAKGAVFCPNQTVDVGDVLGVAGMYGGNRCVHIEAMGHRNHEITLGPWEHGTRIEDTDTNAVCDSDQVEHLIRDALRDGIDRADVRAAAPRLRRAKTLHLSEWAWMASSLEALIENPARRQELWNHIRRFTWWSEALAACPALGDALGRDGMVWHYHPLVLAEWMNELVHAENGEINEAADHEINVDMDEEGRLSHFIRWDANAPAPAGSATGAPPGAWVDADADTAVLHPFANAQNYISLRNDIACHPCVSAVTAEVPSPRQTLFALALLEVYEQVRRGCNFALVWEQAYVCENHVTPDPCIVGAGARHQAGMAMDFRPQVRNSGNVTRFWDSVVYVVDQLFLPGAVARGGEVASDSLPRGVHTVNFRAQSDEVTRKCRSGAVLTAEEINAFCVHAELVPSPRAAAGETDEARGPVHLRLTFVSLEVIDDADSFGSGEWRLNFSLNGSAIGHVRAELNSGQTLSLSLTPQTFELGAEDEFYISVRGAEEDWLGNDDLGEARAMWDIDSEPAWGIGTQTVEARGGHFRVTVRIESLAGAE